MRCERSGKAASPSRPHTPAQFRTTRFVPAKELCEESAESSTSTLDIQLSVGTSSLIGQEVEFAHEVIK